LWRQQYAVCCRCITFSLRLAYPANCVGIAIEGGQIRPRWEEIARDGSGLGTMRLGEAETDGLSL
jgi:hypothetical protein